MNMITNTYFENIFLKKAKYETSGDRVKDDFYSKIPTKNFFYFLPICSLKYA